MRLQGKVAVVTGAASGMGKAIAILYAKEGAKVVVSDLTLEGAGATVAEITAFGGTATAVEADVSQERDVYRLIKAALNSYGTLDSSDTTCRSVFCLLSCAPVEDTLAYMIACFIVCCV